ncbi:MAG: long-chain-fatty-acid--CoA ligase [Burkholderiaceae bacterium]|jgi:long-chain acyl-CoA synthetase|nr:long-chain-fatty-acid--CoA ligase [Burkholderiaceae bacterium]
MTDRPWLTSYPPGVPADIDPSQHRSLVALMQESFVRHARRVAYRFMGRSITYARVDRASRALAVWLQGLGLTPGERVALMMPNCPQYPIAVAAVLRAGLVLVNVNPLYTPRELEHQLRDSGAKAIIIMENFAATLQRCLAQTAVEHVLLTGIGDCVGALKGQAVNLVVRKIKKLVPPFDLPAAARWKHALAAGTARPFTPVKTGPDDLALLQYTGGTTGSAKGAMLLHRNVIANVLQTEAWNDPAMKRVPKGAQPTSVCALPLYHIFAFTVSMMLNMRTGGKLILIPNPRDLKATLKGLARETFHSFPAVNTLFAGIARHPDFGTVNWNNLRISVGGGMAVQNGVAKLWFEKTGCPICEGYGLSEASPTVACNPTISKEYTGSIGVPLPSTYIKLVDDFGHDAAPGEIGEIAVKGPQIMAGYWQRPKETAAVMTEDGYLRTGDIGLMDERGYFRIVDRKKDMILVSGFNVYPNEVENVVSQLPGVLECAAIGIPDEKTGEAVKLFIVKQDPALTAEQVQAYCHKNLTDYKCPKIIEFRADLPKSPVGKMLRRDLRNQSELV